MIRISKILGYTLSAGLLILAVGCRKDIAEQPIPTPEPERLPASLTLTLNASDIYRATIDPETRNLTAPDDDTSKWTEEELLADGRTIRRLTVMLVDSISQEMVAYRHIIYNGDDADPKPIHKPLLSSDDSSEGGNGFVGADGAVDVSLKHSDRVRLTFNYDAPLHGNVERLKHGKYALIAVANYASLPKKDGEDAPLLNHDAVKNENGFVKQIHKIIHKFYGDDSLKMDANLWNEKFLRTEGKGIAKFGASMSGFYNYVLEVALDENKKQPYIRKKLDELPLFTVGYIDLQPGSNVLTDPIWLYRTYSRVRVEVKNYSTEPLSVNHLEFSNNFSKDRTYFCRMPGASNIFEGLNYTAGAPDVSYGESIIAFPYYNTHVEDKTFTEEEKEIYKYYIVADTDSSRNEVGTAQQTIETGQTAAVFDAYISPSRDDKGEKYKYTIEVEYKGASGYNSCHIDEKASAISAGDSFAGRYFLMKVYGTNSNNNNFWVYEAQNAHVRTESMSFDALRQQIIDDKDYRFIWQIVRNGDKYYLRNPINGDYICKFEDTKSVLVYVNNGYSYINILTASNDISSAEPFTVTTDKNNNTFLFLGSSNSQYMNHYGGSSTYMSYWTGTDGNSQFELYPVEFQNGTPCLRKEVVLQTIDNETSAVSDVTEIRRNDFVRILVEVSYNPDKGNFEFEVQPWEREKGGDITFN